MIPKEMIEAAKQIVLERLGSVLNFHGKPVVYSVMSGIEDIIEDALTAALSVQWRGIGEAETARPAAEYHEDMGPVLWWTFPIKEAPYVGSPLDLGRGVKITMEWIEGSQLLERHMTQDVGGWPGYHTHFTRIRMPLPPPPAQE